MKARYTDYEGVTHPCEIILHRLDFCGVNVQGYTIELPDHEILEVDADDVEIER